MRVRVRVRVRVRDWLRVRVRVRARIRVRVRDWLRLRVRLRLAPRAAAPRVTGASGRSQSASGPGPCRPPCQG